MTKSGLMIALSVLLVAPAVADAQGRGRNAQGIPPGQMPPAGQCRVWFDGVAPGKQPRPTDCRSAEEIASRTRNARVIYGSGYGNDPYVYGNRDRDIYTRDRSEAAVIRKTKPGMGVYSSEATAAGYRDGYRKGREDAGDNDRYDPTRHSEYRSATSGYNSRYGSRDEFRNEYRKAFEEGYARGYDEIQRGTWSTQDRNRPGAVRRIPW
jgi:hypothetical protein